MDVAARIFVLAFAFGFTGLGLYWIRLYRRADTTRGRTFAVSRIVCLAGTGVSLAIGALARAPWAFGAVLGFMAVYAGVREWLAWQERRKELRS
jgi:hypothetical protein